MKLVCLLSPFNEISKPSNLLLNNLISDLVLINRIDEVLLGQKVNFTVSGVALRRQASLLAIVNYLL